MKKHVLKRIKPFLFHFLISVLILFSCPLANAIGYDASVAREDIASGETIVKITSFDYENDDEVNSSIWYGIYDAEDLRRFSFLVNNNSRFRSAGVHVCLCASIDMSGVTDFEPIGNGLAAYSAAFPGVSFGGTFDGRGYVIDNLAVKTVGSTKKTYAYTALFGAVQSGAVIRNVVLGAGCTFAEADGYTNGCAASLAARVAEGAVISNVLNLAPVSGNTFCGGLIARVDSVRDRTEGQKAAQIENCTNKGNVTGGTTAGGLIGNVQGNLLLKDCACRADVSAVTTAGGAIGSANNSNISSGDIQAVSVDLSGIRSEGTIIGSKTGGIYGKKGSAIVTQTDCSHYDAESEVPEETKEETLGVRFHGIQLSEGSTLAIRFIASIDAETTYTDAGFRISAIGSPKGELNFPCSSVFTSLLGIYDEQTLVYTAQQLRGSDGYLFAATFPGGTLDTGDSVSFSVYAYASGAEPTDTYSFTLTKTDGGYTVTWNK